MSSEKELRLAMLTAVAQTISRHAEELTQLDQAIGDGDHGINMKRGFDAVMADSAGLVEKPWPEFLKGVGMTLVMKVGGASGPLFGTLFMTLGKELPGNPCAGDVAGALEAAIQAVQARGKSEAGQKTMLDVLVPVAAQLRKDALALTDLVTVAAAAAEATGPMKAIRGRASFLGDRSIGHVDPGARSSALMVAAVVGAVKGES
ncbi:dihydroxyacetone kinase DhaL subunit [Dongia mobilis]|uniref:Dihydroxyacetone kinase DhaL subunit n=1 Tax=Dongia mobilis TaxID=578943 RepID=A0A4R6WIE7_9PROT|nr:dihydroxyacetone kinase subunit DhaL [Dongia mobilis]TDQ77658.1 dihydroxyacetone kinase DhaL subunit [Dongia mobilis]